MVPNPIDPNIDMDQERRLRSAFTIGLVITIVSSITAVATLWLQVTTGDNYYAWVTAVGVVGGISAMILARSARTTPTLIVLIATLFIISGVYVFSFYSIATLIIVFLTLLSLSVVILVAPKEEIARDAIIVTLLGILLSVLDQFWPGTRASLPAISRTIVIVAGGITILIMTITIIRQFPSFSLRGKLIGATLAVALVAVVVVAVGVNIFTTRAITNEVGNNLSILTESQSLAIGEFLSRNVNTLQALSANKIIIDSAQEKNASYANSDDPPSRQIAIASGQWSGTTEEDEIVKNILESAAALELQKYQEVFPENIQLLITDKYGAQIGATRRTRDYFKGDETWWKDAYVNGLGSNYISQPTFDSVTQTYSVIMAVPIHGKTEEGGGEIVGVLQAVINLDLLGNILTSSQFGETGQIEIFLEGDKHLVVDESGEIAVIDTPLDQDAIEYIKNPDAPFIITDFDNITHFLSSIYINSLSREPAVEELEWIVLASQHEEEILRPVAEQQTINTILGIIVVVIAGTVAAFVGQRISQPITNLTNVAKEVAEGNFDVQATIETQDEIGLLAGSFNEMTSQLRESILTLEQRVQNRTQALATTVEVGQRISTILNEDELLTSVVHQVRESFDYYQAQIYLLDKDKQILVMAAGTGDAGEQMIAQGHHIPVGTGLVGRAAENNIAVVVPDTSQAENWLSNPLLPDTKSETAVPIAVGDEVLGVLDVQHNIVNGLQQEDADLLRSVANQMAVAMRNARLYKETQRQAQREALLRNINQKIASTTDMETAMKVAIRELGQATGSPETNVRLKLGREENNH